MYASKPINEAIEACNKLVKEVQMAEDRIKAQGEGKQEGKGESNANAEDGLVSISLSMYPFFYQCIQLSISLFAT